jgi:hypothetical protein
MSGRAARAWTVVKLLLALPLVVCLGAFMGLIGLRRDED